MTKEERQFGLRMDTADDKQLIIEYAKDATNVLDLGAGTGKLARDLAEKYGCHVDAVDFNFKDDCVNTDNVTYYSEEIGNFLTKAKYTFKKYDCVILSAVLHEISNKYLENMLNDLPYITTKDCRIIIREPLCDSTLGPIEYKDENKFVELVAGHIPANKALDYFYSTKKSLDKNDNEERSKGSGTYINVFNRYPEWLNLCFALSYGEPSWNREKHEFRFARSLNYIKEHFDFYEKPFTGFKVQTILDKSYRDHFINAGIPGEAFDLIKYTGMIIVIDYQK